MFRTYLYNFEINTPLWITSSSLEDQMDNLQLWVERIHSLDATHIFGTTSLISVTTCIAMIHTPRPRSSLKLYLQMKISFFHIYVDLLMLTTVYIFKAQIVNGSIPFDSITYINMIIFFLPLWTEIVTHSSGTGLFFFS